MTTYSYLKKGPMRRSPYHLIAEDGLNSLCGQVQRGGDGVLAVSTAPTPENSGLICERCRQIEAIEAVKRVAVASPFVEEQL